MFRVLKHNYTINLSNFLPLNSKYYPLRLSDYLTVMQKYSIMSIDCLV